ATLIRGGELHLPPAAHYDPSQITEAIAEQRITLLNCTPSAFYPLVEQGNPASYEKLDSLRVVFLGGEPISIPRLRPWMESDACRSEVANTYGPTECTDICAYYRMKPENIDAHAVVPIGRPIFNTELLVLDDQLRLCPPGVAGELCVAGQGVGAGYINDPELTAEKFIPHPFSDEPGARLYRTGDSARFLPDRNIEFLGRIDNQVKIRGFRVEFGEIEAVLRKHPLVQDALVALASAPALNRLVAGLVPRESAALNVDDLRAFAAKMLPEYMVPSVFVVLDSLPLTPSGKVDRRALSLETDAHAEPSKTYVPPRTPTEEQIARIWSDVLRLERVGRSDHFFELGGHSLLAIQALSRIRTELAADIPLRAIFESPTVEGLAERLEQAKTQGRQPDDTIPGVSERSPNGSRLSFSQTRMWFMDQIAPESAAYNIAVPIRFTGALRKEALKRSVDELVRRHESLRTTFQNTADELVQVVTPELALEMPEIDLRGIPEPLRLEEAKRLLREEASQPFDLERGPLFRVLLVRLAEDDQVLLLSMHHAVSDQWSLGIIAHEIASLYNAFSQALPASMDPSPVQYADFAVAESRRLTGERWERQLAYWKKQLSGLQPLELPTDHPRPSIQTFHGAHDQLSLTKELVEELKKLGVEENATLFMVFLTAFKALLLRYSGRHDVAVGSPIANRNRTEWERVIGTFVNVLVLRTDLSGNPTFREVLRRVREVALDAFAHQEMPFDKLVEELQPTRDTSRSPLVQVLFNFHNPPPGKIDLAGLSWAPFEIDTWASQFDLCVTIDPGITRKIRVGY
ncbi:MAG: condensation domain-containing protein, partial [Candidatus Binatia bacterium]